MNIRSDLFILCENILRWLYQSDHRKARQCKISLDLVINFMNYSFFLDKTNKFRFFKHVFTMIGILKSHFQKLWSEKVEKQEPFWCVKCTFTVHFNGIFQNKCLLPSIYKPFNQVDALNGSLPLRILFNLVNVTILWKKNKMFIQVILIHSIRFLIRKWVFKFL